ncbi:ACT domain-containing protein [Mycena crocata]|nr:ACT domain-containing protein [Mycena crocata]
MSPPIDDPCLHLHLLPGAYFVIKFEPSQLDDTLKGLLENSKDDGKSFLSITRTFEELSVVGECKDGMPEAYKDASWRAFKISGPMPFHLTGVLAGFVEPLKRAGVPVFAMSTWNTDFILIPKEKVEAAVEALKADSWKFVAE